MICYRPIVKDTDADNLCQQQNHGVGTCWSASLAGVISRRPRTVAYALGWLVDAAIEKDGRRAAGSGDTLKCAPKSKGGSI